MKTTKFLSLVFLSLFSAGLYAQSFMIWTALRVGNKMHSNIDIENYITATRFNTEAKIQLFNLADQDYVKYHELKKAIIKEQFNSALKELGYAMLLEEDATKPRYGSNDGRKGFLTTEREFNQAVQDNENKHLKKFLDKRLGIVKAREYFGQELMDKGYPHRESESATDVYWSWYEYQKEVIKEALRSREVQQYEYVMAMRKHPNLELRPFDISDLKRDLDRVIDQQLQNKKLSPNEIQQILAAHPALPLRIKNLNQVALHSMALGKMEKLDQVGQKKLEQSYRLLEQTFVQELNDQKVERILHYEQISHTLAERYNSVEELKALSEEKMDLFIGEGTYNDFMMARLYSMAAKIKAGEPKRQEYRQQLAIALKEAMVDLKQSIAKRNLGQEHQSLLFEDLVTRQLQESMKELRESKTYLSDMTDMAIWVLKFDAKKASLQDDVIVQVEKKEDNMDSWRALENHLKNQLFIDGLQDYYRNQLSKSAYLLEVNLDGKRRVHSEEAYDLIIKDYLLP